ncbi:MAG: entericidin A/B family lipoprotein [Rhodospirillales bacterium]|nr:entericidin A/B family lipoprotein [Alphaproteobacteria bacterium]USO04134.1 MAG: entericidin A/B family lipoprotein [Rhodospirillales bacterium]
MHKKICMIAVLLLTSGFLAGCSHTFEGAGKDIEDAGEWIQDIF